MLRSCFVSAAGDVSPCVMTSLPAHVQAHRFGGREHPVGSLTFGNVTERPLPAIWRSPVAVEFRRAFRERVWKGGGPSGLLPDACRRCYKLLESTAAS